ncbi:MAG TPA: flagellar hook capping FlgD N-terminal domain-containing protein [Fibrobacteria bacterium]|nr:flagellar hook capping FlgD N-terminal domain-containing protein [Fibrobacteria bacterium]
MSTTSPLTSDVNSIFNPPAAAGRKVTADFSGSELKTSVDSEGDKKLFKAGAKQLGKQDFLQLLVTQMRFQDPLAPTDNQQFVAQLAQFSALEGTQNISDSIGDLSKKLESMVSGQADSASAISNSSATGLIGKSVRVNAEDVVYDPTKAAPIEINVHAEAGDGSVLSILDSEGKIVNALPLEKAGESKVSWNGLMVDGNKAPAGKYQLKVTSRDGAKDTGYTFFESKVTGISYSKTGTRLEVNGQSVAFDQVMHVADAEAAE